MADPRIGNTAAILACDAIVDALDAGAGAGVIRIYTGSPPSDPDDAATGTLLAELTLSDPAFGAAIDADPGAIATANSITGDTSADDTGTAGYFRALDSDDNVIIQGDITATAGGGDLELNDVSITALDTVDITSWTFTVNES